MLEIKSFVIIEVDKDITIVEEITDASKMVEYIGGCKGCVSGQRCSNDAEYNKYSIAIGC